MLYTAPVCPEREKITDNDSHDQINTEDEKSEAMIYRPDQLQVIASTGAVCPCNFAIAPCGREG